MNNQPNNWLCNYFNYIVHGCLYKRKKKKNKVTQQTSPYFFINKAALVLEWRIEDFCKWTAENISSPKNYEVIPSRIIHWLTAERRMEKEKKEGNIYYHFLWARHHDECFIHLSVPSQSFLQWWKCSISSDLILTTTLDKN